MKLYLRFLIPALFLLDECKQPDNNQEKVQKKLSANNKDPTSTSLRNNINHDTLLINTRSAISVWLDTATLDKRRKQYGDDAFETGADDDLNYSSIADSVLKIKELPIVNANNYKYIKFVQSTGISTLIKIDTLPQVYTLYFFDPSKAPHEADVTDIENDFNNFYR